MPDWDKMAVATYAVSASAIATIAGAVKKVFDFALFDIFRDFFQISTPQAWGWGVVGPGLKPGDGCSVCTGLDPRT